MSVTQQQIDLDRLRERVRVAQSSRLRRLMVAPWRELSSQVLRRYAKWLGARHGIPRRAQTFWGGSMTVFFPEGVSERLYRYGYFEADVSELLIARLRPGMVFFDVGAHYGYFSLLASRLVGPQGQVHAFEPTPSTFAVLTRNTQHCSNVKANNLAAYSCDTTVTLTDHGVGLSAYNSIGSGRFDFGGVQTMQEVRAIAIDDYVEQSGVAPNFVKLDAEGVEHEILKGMLGTLERDRPMIALEVGEVSNPTEASSRDAVQLLMDAGYTPFELRDGSVVPHVMRQSYQYMNLLFEQGNDLSHVKASI